jgi:tetratricopeptide (TPR) repeat protein
MQNVRVVLVAAGTLLGQMAAAPAHAQAPAAVTFSADVAPILYANCVTCHRPDGAAPFSLVRYEDARRRATLMARVTRSRYMPPWKPDPHVSSFVGERRLRDREIEVLERWAALGAPEGRDADVPPAPAFAAGWQLGTPDVVVTLPEYLLQAEGKDVFRNFVVSSPVGEQRFVRGLEFRPASRAVHHANIRLDYTAASRQLDEADAGAGYEGVIVRSADYPDGHFLGWTPGQVAPLSPAGLAWTLRPGADFVVQLHMQPTGTGERISAQIGLFFTSDPPARAPAMLRLGRQNIDIAPGVRDYSSKDSYTLPVDVHVHAVQPHSHSRATAMKAWAVLPDGTSRALISIPAWDFRWQDVYRLAAPLTLPAGTTIHSEYRFDNSDRNPRNPASPPARAVWGFTSADEMADVWIQVMTRTDADRSSLVRHFRRKAAAEDVAGSEMQLRVNPSNAALHDDVAVLYLELGDATRAAGHFEAVVRLRPGSAAAHYNLGTAMEALQRFDRAASLFSRAIELDPGYARAHVNLGNMRLLERRLADAAEHYRVAIRLEAGNAEAHNNLGRVLGLLGDRRAAIDQIRQSLGIRPTSTAHVNLANLLLQDADTAGAVAELTEAARLSPEWHVPLAALSWIYSSHPDARVRHADRAIELAERAWRLKPDDAMTLDAVASSYASAGRFDAAIQRATEAITLARRSGAAALAAEIAKRLALYRQRRPFIQP